MASALTALATYTIPTGSAFTLITFSSIPSTYRDLRVVVTGATDAEGNIFLKINGDASSNYSQVNMRSFATSSAASSSGTGARVNSNYSTGLQTSSRAINIYDIFDYAQTNKHKSILIRANHSDEVDAIAARWASTSAITSLSITANDAAAFTAGSTFSLYGVSA